MTGLEPAASGVTGRRSNQLSYTPFAVLIFEDWSGSAVRSGVYVKQPPASVKRCAWCFLKKNDNHPKEDIFLRLFRLLP